VGSDTTARRTHFSRAVSEWMWLATAALDMCENAVTLLSFFPCQPQHNRNITSTLVPVT